MCQLLSELRDVSLSSSQGGCGNWCGCYAVSDLDLQLILEERLFSTVLFLFALHVQNMYKTTENIIQI